jgi:multicomponent Na+:H+ antiporter subunit A
MVLAVIAPALHRVAPEHTGRVLALAVAALFSVFALTPHEAAPLVYAWAPSLDLHVSLLFDGLGKLMALIVSGIGSLILLYANGYLHGDARLPRLYATLLAFMGAMLGVVLGGNLLFIFVCWELTSVTSFILIGFDHERPAARAAALQALLVTGAGGLCLLAGVILLGQAAGSYELGALASAPGLREHGLYVPALLLILAGAFTKSAQVPFHFWLPGAMEAPTPISAYLHSATMVKAGVVLLARLNPALGGTELWFGMLCGFGGATMLLGNLGSLLLTDLKRVLAYSTVGMLGTLVLLIGIGTQAALAACVTMLLAHALYKGALFMVAGGVDHAVHTRDTTLLSGLGRAMPITWAAASMAALSCMGVLPLLGFIAKEKSYVAALGAPEFALWIVAASLVASAAAFAMAAIVGVRPFMGRPMEQGAHAHEGSFDLWLGPMLLGVCSLWLGATAGWPMAELLEAAAGSIYGSEFEVALKLWAGTEGVYGQALLLSGATVAIGAFLFALRAPLRSLAGGLSFATALAPQRVYQLLYDGSLGVAAQITRRVQNGLLNSYVRTVVLTLVGISLWSLWRQPHLVVSFNVGEIRTYEIGIVALILVSCLVAVRSESRMAAIVALGVAGLGVTLVFALFSGPDLAMTQIMVETLTVLLFVLVFYHLPQYARLSSSFERVRDLVVSLIFGGLMTLLVLAASTDILDAPLSEFYAQNSLIKGHGRNVVNVILVDFRALDTLGEITVLAAAAIGVVAMLRLKPAHKEGA